MPNKAKSKQKQIKSNYRKTQLADIVAKSTKFLNFLPGVWIISYVISSLGNMSFQNDLIDFFAKTQHLRQCKCVLKHSEGGSDNLNFFQDVKRALIYSLQWSAKKMLGMTLIFTVFTLCKW